MISIICGWSFGRRRAKRKKSIKKVFHGSISIKINFYDLLLHTGGERESVNERWCYMRAVNKNENLLCLTRTDMYTYKHAATATTDGETCRKFLKEQTYTHGLMCANVECGRVVNE